jgi:hypothetical protein
VPLESTESKLPSRCTCFHRQSHRPNSSPTYPQPRAPQAAPPQSRPTSTPLPTNQSPPRTAIPNKHSSLMQTAALSAYHTGEPQRSPIKSCSLLQETDPRSDTHNDPYEFVDNSKKASYLTGSARCTLVTTSATAHTNYISTNNATVTSTSSRARFGKSASR